VISITTLELLLNCIARASEVSMLLVVGRAEEEEVELGKQVNLMVFLGMAAHRSLGPACTRLSPTRPNDP